MSATTWHRPTSRRHPRDPRIGDRTGRSLSAAPPSRLGRGVTHFGSIDVNIDEYRCRAKTDERGKVVFGADPHGPTRQMLPPTRLWLLRSAAAYRTRSRSRTCALVSLSWVWAPEPEPTPTSSSPLIGSPQVGRRPGWT